MSGKSEDRSGGVQRRAIAVPSRVGHGVLLFLGMRVLGQPRSSRVCSRTAFSVPPATRFWRVRLTKSNCRSPRSNRHLTSYTNSPSAHLPAQVHTANSAQRVAKATSHGLLQAGLGFLQPRSRAAFTPCSSTRSTSRQFVTFTVTVPSGSILGLDFMGAAPAGTDFRDLYERRRRDNAEQRRRDSDGRDNPPPHGFLPREPMRCVLEHAGQRWRKKSRILPLQSMPAANPETLAWVHAGTGWPQPRSSRRTLCMRSFLP